MEWREGPCEVAPTGVMVQMLHPGFNKTGMTAKYSHIWHGPGLTLSDCTAPDGPHSSVHHSLSSTYAAAVVQSSIPASPLLHCSTTLSAQLEPPMFTLLLPLKHQRCYYSSFIPLVRCWSEADKRGTEVRGPGMWEVEGAVDPEVGAKRWGAESEQSSSHHVIHHVLSHLSFHLISRFPSSLESHAIQ